MIIAIIFLLHIAFVIYVAIKRKSSEGFSTAIIDVVLIIVLFSVGWSLSTMLTKLIFPAEGYGKELNLDTISLTILSIIEFFFYKSYYKDLFTSSGGKEK